MRQLTRTDFDVRFLAEQKIAADADIWEPREYQPEAPALPETLSPALSRLLRTAGTLRSGIEQGAVYQEQVAAAVAGLEWAVEELVEPLKRVDQARRETKQWRWMAQLSVAVLLGCGAARVLGWF